MSPTVSRTEPRAARVAADSRVSVNAPVSPLAVRIDTYGPALVALYFLATTRWGSYVLPGPPYVGDVMLMGLLANRALLLATGRRASGGRDALLALLATGLISWTLVRLSFGTLGTDAARDAAPYLYAVIAFLVVPLNAAQERHLSRWITLALVAHATWVTVAWAVGGPERFPPLPSGDDGGAVRVFTIRGDIDTLACGLLAAISLHRTLAGRAPLVNLLLTGWALVLVVGALDARGGLLAVLMALFVVLLLGPARARARGGERLAPVALRPRRGGLAAVAVLIVALPVGMYLARDAPVVRSLPLGFNPNADYRFVDSNGAATARARLNSWRRVADWVSSDPGRVVAGTGLGPNYFVESGAGRLLSARNREEVRSPHNAWLNTWARLGLLGLALFVGIWAAGIRLGVMVASRSPKIRDTDVLTILLVVAVPIVASFGVVLESPFGAIPYFWALGYLSVRACQLGALRTFSSVMSGPRAAPGVRSLSR